MEAPVSCWGCEQGIPLDKYDCHVMPDGDGGLCLNIDITVPTYDEAELIPIDEWVDCTPEEAAGLKAEP